MEFGTQTANAGVTEGASIPMALPMCYADFATVGGPWSQRKILVHSMFSVFFPVRKLIAARQKKTFFWFLYGQLCISCMAVCTKLVVSSSMCSVAVATGSTPPSSLSTGDQHLKMDSLLKPWTSGLVVPTFITAWVSYLGYDKCQGGMDSWMFW